jgi:Fe-S cluster biosynthesis and repair protein YggX
VAEMNSRIEQFRKMANDDPTNEVAHFSLGREYLAGGQYEAAIASLGRCLELNPNISKAYQNQAQALLKLNRNEEAIAKLTEGVKRADARGEMMPRNEMMQMLKDLGAPVPELKATAVAEQALGEGELVCNRCHKVKRKLPKPPYKGAQGLEIFEKICADCWREWIPMGTKVINELRLPLNDPQAQKMYDQHMLEFLSLR